MEKGSAGMGLSVPRQSMAGAADQPRWLPLNKLVAIRAATVEALTPLPLASSANCFFHASKPAGPFCCRFAAADSAHRWIMPQPFGVIHVLVSETAKY